MDIPQMKARISGFTVKQKRAAACAMGGIFFALSMCLCSGVSGFVGAEIGARRERERFVSENDRKSIVIAEQPLKKPVIQPIPPAPIVEPLKKEDNKSEPPPVVSLPQEEKKTEQTKGKEWTRETFRKAVTAAAAADGRNGVKTLLGAPVFTREAYDGRVDWYYNVPVKDTASGAFDQCAVIRFNLTLVAINKNNERFTLERIEFQRFKVK